MHAGQGSDYMVALSDRIVTAPEASLAPDMEAGDTALYEAQRGEEAPVTVVAVDASMWYVTSRLFACQHHSWQLHLCVGIGVCADPFKSDVLQTSLECSKFL